MTTELAVVGAAGRMGSAVLEAATERDGTTVVAAVVEPGSEVVGETLEPGEVTAIDDPTAAATAADVFVDFSAPEATVEVAEVSARTGTPLVSGTTGLTDTQRSTVDSAAERAPVLRASNFSVGVNLLDRLVALASQATDGGFDIEISEAHHRHKVDAPSGTALMLGETAADARGQSLAEVARWGREGEVGERTDEEIGFQVVRGGGIVGEHTVHLCGPDEKLELTHRSLDRSIFAQGALKAVEWIVDRPVGRYDMEDVLFG
ncbi:MAG: 4-hydroxy-tetrahydrodipicolinate reductase [Bradymonadaceae bacterium]